MKLRNNEYLELFDYRFKFRLVDRGVTCNLCGHGGPCIGCRLFNRFGNSLCLHLVGLTKSGDSRFSVLSRKTSL